MFYYSGINNITIGENVTEIGGSAFEMCQKLNGKVIIPNSVQTIGACAFYNCDKLTSVTLPKNDNFKTINERLFYHCDTLVDVTIPDSVTTIGNYAFENCKNIEKVYIPDSVIKIGEKAFYKCNGIKYITIGQGIEDNSFGEDSENSNTFRSVKEDGKDIIKKHEVINFSQIKLPDEKGIIDGEEVYISTKYGYVVYGASYLLNAINGSQEGDFIFGKKEESDENFSLLRYLRDNDDVLDDIPEKYSPKKNVEYIYRIDDGVFAGHTEIKEITIPGGVYEIGNGVFNGCSSIIKLTINEGDSDSKLKLGFNEKGQNTGKGLFYDCPIEEITLNRNIDYDGTNFAWSPFQKDNNKLKTVNIGSDVTNLNKYIFKDCINLTSVNIQENSKLQTIEYNAFEGCSKLTNIKNNNISCVDLAKFTDGWHNTLPYVEL